MPCQNRATSIWGMKAFCAQSWADYLQGVQGRIAVRGRQQAIHVQVQLLVAHCNQQIHCWLLGLRWWVLPKHQCQPLQELLNQKAFLKLSSSSIQMRWQHAHMLALMQATVSAHQERHASLYEIYKAIFQPTFKKAWQH